MENKKKRSFILIVCLIFFFHALISFLFIAKESNHDCIGEECPICECIETTKSINKTVNITKVDPPVILTVSLTFTLVSLFASKDRRDEEYDDTLVNRKIRLNN